MRIALRTLVGLGFLLGVSLGAGAMATEKAGQANAALETGGFQRIEQPLSRKIAVTLGGSGLIGLELWWFLFSKPIQ